MPYNPPNKEIDAALLTAQITKLRGSIENTADVAVVIPVNAQQKFGDLVRVLQLVGDVARYDGKHTVEVMLVINNYPAENPPPEIELYRSYGINVVAVPALERLDGRAIPITARMYGVRSATTEKLILFDADCRLHNATALINWYVKQLSGDAKVAYAHVSYYDHETALSIKARIWAHHLSRWAKRAIFRIPTTRGSSYGVNKSWMIEAWDGGWLADDCNVGPVGKAQGGPVRYSGKRQLVVYTSGRLFNGEKGWRHLVWYLFYRLKYNIRVLPVRKDAAKRTEGTRRQYSD